MKYKGFATQDKKNIPGIPISKFEMGKCKAVFMGGGNRSPLHINKSRDLVLVIIKQYHSWQYMHCQSCIYSPRNVLQKE